jgi:hypothetical protein
VSIVLSLDDPNIKQKLATLPEHMIEWAEEVLMDRAHYMRDIAQVLVRVETGSLRDSIRVERGGKGQFWREVRVRAGGYVVNPKTGRLVDYAVFVEKNYPFMLPAFLQIKDEIAYMIKSLVVEKVKET